MRYFNPALLPPHAHRQLGQSPAGVDRVYVEYQRLHALGLVPVVFDREDVECVGRYIAYVELIQGPTWQRLEQGGILGVSWFLHELAELRVLLERRVDVFSDDALAVAYPSAHGHALLVEHSYLYALACERGYTLREPGSLIRFNPTVPPSQREWDFNRAVSQDYGLSFADEDEAEVLRFFEELA